MTTDDKLIENMRKILHERGITALEMAKTSALKNSLSFKPASEALNYFFNEIWYDVLHPGLISLACESVGGNPATTTKTGAAIVLLSAAADIHDDVIDQSKTKDDKKTVFGKFGKDIAILLGDELLFEGLYLLHEACELLPMQQKKAVLELVKKAFLGMGSAEAEEASLRGRFDLPAEEYSRIIEAKVAVGEATMKLGAVLGGGTLQEIDTLGHYGRTLGILMISRDEIVDVFEADELQNRAKNECLPLPVLLAFNDPQRKDKITMLLENSKLTERQVDEIVKLVMDSPAVNKLKKNMIKLVNDEVILLDNIGCKGSLELILSSILEGI